MWSSDVVARRVAACTRSFPWNRAVESVVRTGDQGLRVSRNERGTERIAWVTATWNTAAWAIEGRENATAVRERAHLNTGRARIHAMDTKKAAPRGAPLQETGFCARLLTC